jgi:HAD superfamily hydrolase (TIGR01509 family)
MKNKIKNIKGILFDLDGTLLQTEEVQKQGFNQVLDFYNIDHDNLEYSQFIGRGMKEIESWFIKEYHLNIKEGEMREKRKEIILKLFETEKLPYSHFAIEILDFLHGKFPMGICSAGEQKEIFLKLKTNNILKYFDFYISSEDVENSKPSPDIYKKGIENLKLKPEECLCFEDTFSGATSAKSAGAICFVIPNEYEKNIRDFTFTDKVLNSLEEGLNTIKEHVN